MVQFVFINRYNPSMMYFNECDFKSSTNSDLFQKVLCETPFSEVASWQPKSALVRAPLQVRGIITSALSSKTLSECRLLK